MSVTKKQQIGLVERSVVYVCRGVMMGKRRGISAATFSKRVSLQYRWLRECGNIPKHRRPSLGASCLRRLIAFIYTLPRNIRLADALEGVFVGCIEYYRMNRQSPRRLEYYDYDGDEDDMPMDY